MVIFLIPAAIGALVIMISLLMGKAPHTGRRPSENYIVRRKFEPGLFWGCIAEYGLLTTVFTVVGLIGILKR